ncbi:MAG: aminodeoxychorismate synthase component I [Bacteroidales bacterium]
MLGSSKQGIDCITRMNRLGRAGEPFVFILDFEGNKPLVLTVSEAEQEGIHLVLPGLAINKSRVENFVMPSLRKVPIPFEKYLEAFEMVMMNLRRGNSYLVNLTFPTWIEMDSSLDYLFAGSSAPYKLLFKNDFLVFSPEPFVRISNGHISSFPMKGTIRSSVPDAGSLILANAKEAAEHATIVDLIRNDLSMVAKEVIVKRYRYLEEIRTNGENLLQVSSEVSGILPSDYREHIGDILAALLPAGSVTGAPKEKTVEIIIQAEQQPRGYYTGIFGHFDGDKLESAVMIRYIEQIRGEFQYRSGGGITSNSIAEDEYREMIDKVYVPVS